VGAKGNGVYRRRYATKLDPDLLPGSREMLGVFVVVAVRSNKGVALSLLFRHSIMAVVDIGRVFPPYLMQWKRLGACFCEPALL
jgi:hypothetical protein